MWHGDCDKSLSQSPLGIGWSVTLLSAHSRVQGANYPGIAGKPSPLGALIASGNRPALTEARAETGGFADRQRRMRGVKPMLRKMYGWSVTLLSVHSFAGNLSGNCRKAFPLGGRCRAGRDG